MVKTQFKKSFRVNPESLSTRQLKMRASVLRKMKSEAAKEIYREYTEELRERGVYERSSKKEAKKPVYDNMVGYGKHRVN